VLSLVFFSDEGTGSIISDDDVVDGRCCVSAGIVSATAPNIAQAYVKENPSTLQADVQADKKFKIEALNFSGVAADPSAGTVVSFVVVFRKSSYGPFDN
jgi:hypothetical protein